MSGGFGQRIPDHSDNSPAHATVAVAGGKGGVGKSTVSLSLALALAKLGFDVGLLDADFHSPDIPRMINLARTKWLRSWTLWNQTADGPMKLDPLQKFGVKFMSVGFLIADEQPLSWEASLTSLILRQFLLDVNWQSPDVLILDLPPGTADLQQQIFTQVPLSGVIIVVTPQDVAHLDARKVVSMCQQTGIRILGGIENMSDLMCPCCGCAVEVFPACHESRSIWNMGIERLGKIPFDPGVSAGGEKGYPALLEFPHSTQTQAFMSIAKRIMESRSS